MNIRTLALFSAAAAFAVPALRAQETVVTTTTAQPVPVPAAVATTMTTTSTNTAGTIQEFTPGASRLVVRSTAGAPVTYTYSKRTTFVDAAGNVVAAETIRSGDPTTVYYTMEAGQPVVSRVVVNRTATVTAPVAAPVTHVERTETTTTTTGKK